MGTVYSIIYYIGSLFALFGESLDTLFKQGHIKHIIFSFLLLIAIATIIFFYSFSSKSNKEKKKIAKRYFLWFFTGAFDVAGIIAIITSIIFINDGEPGILLMICSILSVVIITFIALVFNKKIKHHKSIFTILFTNKNTSAKIDEFIGLKPKSAVKKSIYKNAIKINRIYCHKCGKKLTSNSNYCNFCGSKLK